MGFHSRICLPDSGVYVCMPSPKSCCIFLCLDELSYFAHSKHIILPGSFALEHLANEYCISTIRFDFVSVYADLHIMSMHAGCR